MENTYSKTSIFKNFVWKFLERFSSLIVTLAVALVLARVLDPSLFGLVAMISVCVTVSNIFVTGGLGIALIQKKDTDEIDFSSMFWVNMAFSIILYLLLFFHLLILQHIMDVLNYP